MATEWTIPAARHKSKRDFLCPLSQAAQDVLAKLPVKGRKGWIFTTDGNTPISGFSKGKRAFDEDVLAELRKADPNAKLERWTTHDLRRTARSLMSRAGCDVDHAERALGHVVGGVRGVYDRHEFKAEKARVFEALAAQVERILNPQSQRGATQALRRAQVSATSSTASRQPSVSRGQGVGARLASEGSVPGIDGSSNSKEHDATDAEKHLEPIAQKEAHGARNQASRLRGTRESDARGRYAPSPGP